MCVFQDDGSYQSLDHVQIRNREANARRTKYIKESRNLDEHFKKNPVARVSRRIELPPPKAAVAFEEDGEEEARHKAVCQSALGPSSEYDSRPRWGVLNYPPMSILDLLIDDGDKGEDDRGLIRVCLPDGHLVNELDKKLRRLMSVTVLYCDSVALHYIEATDRSSSSVDVSSEFPRSLSLSVFVLGPGGKGGKAIDAPPPHAVQITALRVCPGGISYIHLNLSCANIN